MLIFTSINLPRNPNPPVPVFTLPNPPEDPNARPPDGAAAAAPKPPAVAAAAAADLKAVACVALGAAVSSGFFPSSTGAFSSSLVVSNASASDAGAGATEDTPADDIAGAPAAGASWTLANGLLPAAGAAPAVGPRRARMILRCFKTSSLARAKVPASVGCNTNRGYINTWVSIQ